MENQARHDEDAPIVHSVDTNEAAIAETIARAAWDLRAKDISVLDVRGLVTYTDFFVICSGASDRQVKSIADAVQDALAELNYKPRGVEGAAFGHWVVLDYGDVVAHIFHEQERDLYSLERLWSDAPRLDVGLGLNDEDGDDAEG